MTFKDFNDAQKWWKTIDHTNKSFRYFDIYHRAWTRLFKNHEIPIKRTGTSNIRIMIEHRIQESMIPLIKSVGSVKNLTLSKNLRSTTSTLRNTSSPPQIQTPKPIEGDGELFLGGEICEDDFVMVDDYFEKFDEEAIFIEKEGYITPPQPKKKYSYLL